MRRRLPTIVLFLLVAGIVVYLIFDKIRGRPQLVIEDNSSYQVYSIEVPLRLDFCGERVPVRDPEVHERLDRELHVATYYHSSTILIAKRTGRFFPIIERILKEEGMPEDLKYVAIVESNLTQPVSPAGAEGMWQFMPQTAEYYGLEVNDEVDERYHVEKSTRAACKYFRDAHRMFGSWTSAAASYNLGMGGMQNQLRNQRADSYYDLLLNQETSRYVFRILAYKAVLENPADYGFRIPNSAYYRPEATRRVTVSETIPSLVDFAIEQGTTYKTLFTLNPWLRAQSLTIKEEGKTYTLVLPVGGNQTAAHSDTL